MNPFLGRRQFFWWILLLGICCHIGSCDKREQQSCRMANEYVVARSESAPTALEVLRIDKDRIAIFWSADKKSYIALVNNEGIPTTAAVPLTPPKTVEPTAKTFWPADKQFVLDAVAIRATLLPDGRAAVSLLCLDGDNATAIFSAVVNIHSLSVERFTRTGSSGLYARHLAQMYLGDALVVGWPDTTEAPQSVHLSRLHPRTLKPLEHSEIAQKNAVFGPSMQSNGDRGVILWSHVANDAVQLFVTPVDASGKGGRPVLLDTLELFDADAHVVPYRNGFAAVYRDNRDGDRTEEFYFTLLDAEGRSVQPARRISRADGPQGPILSIGDQYLFSAAVRSYNNNYLVGFNRFDRLGTKTGGEFQVYADKCDFIRAGMVAAANKVVLIYAENADTGGRILASTISCGKKK